MRRPWRRFLFAAVLLAAVGVLLFAGKSLDAGVVGSPHDFSADGPYTQSAAIAPSGACSACHIPHGADVYGLWTRDLTLYRTKLGMDGSLSSEPNYVHAPTIQCYDCHDSHDDTLYRIDAVPAKTDFSAGHYPQNIAFGFTKTGLGSMTEDGPGGSVSGYYENKPPDSASNYGADPNLNPGDNTQLVKTGGHYFKYVDPDGGTTSFKIGDKLPCRDCHDPHAWDSQWQAFFRKSWPTGAISSRLGSTVPASSYMANDTGTRDTLNGGRKLCTACHGNSDTLNPVNFSDIDAQYVSTAIVRPPASIAEHANADTTTPCVSCHGHNSVDVSCGECHGFAPPNYPPGKNPDNVTGSAGLYAVTPEVTHAIHFGKQNGSDNVFSKYAFQCNVCHSYSAMGTKAPSNHGSDNVDIDFDFSTLDDTRSFIAGAHPAHFQPFIGSTYVRTTCGPGGRGGVYCHSDGHDNTDATGYYKNVTWGTASLACSGCHGNVSYDNTNMRYGMPDKSDHANSHEKHVVANSYECSVCHFNTATGTSPGTRAIKGATNPYHVNGNLDVSFDPEAATGGYTLGTKTCSVSCHGAVPQVWGGTLSGGCFGCHSGTEQVYKPQIDYGTAGTPNPVDNNEYLYSGHGRSSGQGNYPGSGNLPAGFSNYTTAPAVCYVCHSQAAAHTTKSANDPFRLGSTTDSTLGGMGNFTGAWADNTDLLCLGCHGNSTQRSGHDNMAKGATTIDSQTHARGITGTKYTWPGPNYPWKCVDCHDPHGDGKSGAERYMMIRSGINAPIDNTDSSAGSDVKSIPKRTDANVRSVTFNSIAGYAAGSYAQPGNGTGGTWGPCEVCHTQTTAFSRTLDNTASHATRTNRCTTCHPHKAGFAATACKGCHGPDGVATGAAAPDISAYWTSSGHGTAAIATKFGRAVECEDCHDAGYLTAGAHKTDGSVPGTPPGNINTEDWPGKDPRNADTNPNVNTSHLKAAFIASGPADRAAVARTFDNHCATAAGCHDADYHRHNLDNGPTPRDVMRFGDHSTIADPKTKSWYTLNSYPTDFFKSRSPWIDDDISLTGLADTTNYGLCVSCHDPHGTSTTNTSFYPGLGTTNHMVRGNWRTESNSFCNIACHTR